MIRRFGFWPLLAALAILALTLRLVGLDWDRGLYLHPDERFVVWVTTDMRWPQSIAQFFNSAESPLNPYNTQHESFVYGTFPSFLVKAIAGLFGMDSYGQIYLVGRATNAVFDTGTVVLTALLARRFFNDRAGLLAGFLLAFTPLFLQSAHFFTVDTISVFFATAVFVCVVRSWDRSSIGWMALAGVMVGLAGASKPNYLISIAFLALPVLELIRLRGWRALVPRLDEREYPAIPALLTGGFLAFWIFRFAMPYAFSGPRWWNISLNQTWLDDIAFWRAVQTGLIDMKPSIQWIDRTPVIYILQNMVLWGMGVALGAMALISLAIAVWRLVRSDTWPSWWWLGMVGWIIAAIAMYGTGIAQNQRYLMHIYPFLIVLVAGFLVELELKLHRKWIAQLLTTGVVLYTLLFGLAFDSLYIRPITRIEASEWIYANVETGAVLSNEYWDDALPSPLPGEDPYRYTGMTLDLYADESENNGKVVTLVGQLSQVDYIVLSSNRVIDSVVRQPERYPVAVRYYEMLISGELGFEPVAHFHQGPEILGIEWDDRSAEESLTVYEHPEVRIFAKTDNFSAQFVHDELNAAWGNGGYHYIPGDPLPDQMLMSHADMTSLNEHGSWDDQVRDGFLQQHPLISWWVAMQIVGLAAWPLTWRAFRNLPDMAWMLAKAVGLVAMSAITLALVSWRGMSLDRGTVAISILMLLAIGLAAERCIWDEFRYKLRRHWRSIIAGELLFLGVFLATALLRSWQQLSPDHNLMQLTGVMRSVSLPPIDPWLSGGLLHTYWAGILPWASLGRMLSLEPVVVANLAAIGAVAVIAGVTWSLVSAISRSRIGVITALIVAFGSSTAFAAGIAPKITSSSVDLVLLSVLMLTIVLIHALMTMPRQRWTHFFVTALLAGAIISAIGWGLLFVGLVLALGLAIREWSRRELVDAWWPNVRRFVLELVGLIGLGIVLWYPAYAAHTATGRNLMSMELWPLSILRDQLGAPLILLLMIVVGVGAVSVLATLLAEETPGIIVAGIAIGAVFLLLLLTWRFDSGLAFLLLVSLLAITAAWHWLEDQWLLWSAGLILIASLMLAIAQTRSFRPDPAGVTSALQLLPLAWILLVIAVGIAFGRAMKSFATQSALPGVIAASLVTIAMLFPTIDAVRTSELQRAPLSDPAIIASDGELQAARWLQQNTAGVPIILTGDGAGTGASATISAITGFPTVLGSHDVERRTRPGWERMVGRRNMDVTTIYTGMHDWPMVAPYLDRYSVRYIIVGAQERIWFGNVDASFAVAVENGHLQLVFEHDGVVIYQVADPGD